MYSMLSVDIREVVALIISGRGSGVGSGSGTGVGVGKGETS